MLRLYRNLQIIKAFLNGFLPVFYKPGWLPMIIDYLNPSAFDRFKITVFFSGTILNISPSLDFAKEPEVAVTK
jgi:hypothetical protein